MQLTDKLTAAILDPSAGLELRVPLVWNDRISAVRAQVGVHNSHGLPLFLGAQVIKAKPWKLALYLMIYNTHIRRLDMNGSHRNRMGDRERWTERTHKHAFTEAYRDSAAYTPDDIPEIPLVEVTGDHYRKAFEAFCGECNVGLSNTYAWSAPVIGTSPVMLDGEA